VWLTLQDFVPETGEGTSPVIRLNALTIRSVRSTEVSCSNRAQTAIIGFLGKTHRHFRLIVPLMRLDTKRPHPSTLSGDFLQFSLFQLFLTLDAVPCPWHRFQTLGIDLFSARDALSKLAIPHAQQCALDHLQ
jgi:hypothetical protein